MSKSEDNFLTVSALEEKGYDPLAYRLFCLQSHYRKPLLFSFEALDNISNAYNKMVKRVSQLQNDGQVEQDKFKFFADKFAEALCDDLNTSNAVSVIYDVLNSDANDKTKYELIKSFDEVLSLNLMKEKQSAISGELESHIEEMISKRKDARKRKDFAEADRIRDELLKEGIVLEDTKEGTTWRVL